MSRSGYLDIEQYPGQFALWQGNVQRAIRSKRGQAFMRDLRAALDQMPVKRLVYGTLQHRETGDVCALGAVGVRRGLTLPEINDEDYGASAEELGRLFDIAKPMAAEVQYINDEAAYTHETDEQRYRRVSAWVDEYLSQEHPDG